MDNLSAAKSDFFTWMVALGKILPTDNFFF
jgi:hypothetical protein